MAIIGALDKTKHLEEFNEVLFVQDDSGANDGVLSALERRQLVRGNLGLLSLAGDEDFDDTVSVAADVLPIPVTAMYVAKTTGADAEALTLADGSDGQVLVINLEVDGGGDGTLTPDTSSGWATIVFADAGDNAALLYVNDTVGWVILGLSGVAAPPAMTV